MFVEGIQSKANELKVGLIAGICLVIGVVFLLSAGSIKFFDKGYKVKILFAFADGLDLKSPVMVAGVKAGTVDTIRIVYNKFSGTFIEVGVWLDKNVMLHQDAKVYINTLGLMGKKYVEIMPGTVTSPMVANDGIIRGVDPTRFEEVFERGNVIAVQMQETMTSMNEIIQLNKDDLHKALSNLKETSEQLKISSLDISKALQNFIGNLDEMAATSKEEIAAVMGTVRQTSDQLKDKLIKITDNVQNISVNINEIIASNKTEITSAIENLKLASETMKDGLDKISKDTNKLLTSLNLIADESKDDIITISGNLKDVSNVLKDDFGKLTASINKLIDDMDTLISSNKDDIREVTTTTKELAKNIQKDSKTILGNLEVFTADLKMVSTESKDKIVKLVNQLESTSGKLSVATNDFNDLMGGIKKGQGVAGKVLYDKDVEKDVDSIVKDLKELAADLKKNPWKLINKP